MRGRGVTHVVGSSKNIILGSPINEIAMLSLLLIPPDKLDTNILAALSSPTYTHAHTRIVRFLPLKKEITTYQFKV